MDSSLEDLFAQDEPVATLPKYYDAEYVRPKGLGTISVQLVESHALWGNHLWNGGRWLAGHFDGNPHLVEGKSILEFGAAAGLPSIIAALRGASQVVVTDYPDKQLIDCLAVNLQRNCPTANIKEAGFLWGSSTEDILALNGGNKFDVLILCDLLFNHSEHRKLFKSCQETLHPSGQVP